MEHIVCLKNEARCALQELVRSCSMSSLVEKQTHQDSRETTHLSSAVCYIQGFIGADSAIPAESWRTSDQSLGVFRSGELMPYRKSWLSRATLGQWDAVDDEWKRPERAASDGRLAGLLIVISVSLVTYRYAAHPTVFQWLFPKLWAHAELRPLNSALWWNWVVTVCLAGPPWLYSRCVLHESLTELGFRWGLLSKHWRIYAAAILGLAPLVYLASTSPSFQQQYPIFKSSKSNWQHVLIWEFSYGCQFVATEFLFRGLLIVPLARKIGALSVAVAVIPYCLIHIGKPLPEAMGSIAAGLFLGTMALRSRSLLAGIVIHLMVAWSMDLLALWKSDAFG